MFKKCYEQHKHNKVYGGKYSFYQCVQAAIEWSAVCLSVKHIDHAASVCQHILLSHKTHTHHEHLKPNNKTAVSL